MCRDVCVGGGAGGLKGIARPVRERERGTNSETPSRGGGREVGQ